MSPGVFEMKHSLKYFYIASSGVPNFPEFVAVATVDGVQMFHYNSNTQRAVGLAEQDWVNKATTDDPQYWERKTGRCMAQQHSSKADIEIVKQRFNHTGGIHVYQSISVCEWDDETGDTNSYEEHGYDGEDFIALDLKTLTWNAPTPEAFDTKQIWSNDKHRLLYKNYFTKFCIDLLKKYLDYGKSSLQRTVPPSVSLLQKSPSSPVTCHATGFYPDRVKVFWRRDGEELHEDVDHGELLPNQDGTFQMSVHLDLSSVTPEDWKRFDCVVHLSGVKDDIITKLDQSVIRTNWVKTDEERDLTATIISVSAVLAVVIIVAIGITMYMKEKGYTWKNR
ncbi:major histocompatibility complex class I-related gene protein-like [Polymixia lowei]